MSSIWLRSLTRYIITNATSEVDMRCQKEFSGLCGLMIAVLMFGSAHAADQMTTAPRQEAFARAYHGIRVPDPYAWLERGGSADVKAWSDAQNENARR